MILSLEELEILEGVSNFSTRLSDLYEELMHISVLVEPKQFQKTKSILEEYTKGVNTTKQQDTKRLKNAIEDMRIKSVYLKNYRKFPDSQYQYGFELDALSSIIVIGNNGTGKSSLYDAIEQKYTGRVSESLYRGIKDAQTFYPHDNNSTPVIAIEAGTTSDISEVARNYAFMPTFFCSEGNLKDWIELMPLSAEDSWTKYFSTYFNVRNIHELILCLQELHASVENIQKSDYQEEIETELDIINQEILLLATLKSNKTFTSKIQRIIDDVKKRIERIDNSFFQEEDVTNSINELKNAVGLSKESKNFLSSGGLETSAKIRSILVEMEREALVTPPSKGLADKILINYNDPQFGEERYKEYKQRIRTELTRSLDYMMKIADDKVYDLVVNGLEQRRSRQIEKNEKINEWRDGRLLQDISDLIDLLEASLNHYICTFVRKERLEKIVELLNKGNFLRENETLNCNVDGDKILISVSCKDGSQIFRKSPKSYFNTFRLKLFTLCVQVVMGIILMKERNIRVPIVYDDIFYASDFENRHRLRSYFSWIFDVYESILPEEKAIPLQLVFFTHDEQIFSVCRDTIHDAYFGRLFDYTLMENRVEDGKVNLLVKIKGKYSK